MIRKQNKVTTSVLNCLSKLIINPSGLKVQHNCIIIHKVILKFYLFILCRTINKQEILAAIANKITNDTTPTDIPITMALNLFLAVWGGRGGGGEGRANDDEMGTNDDAYYDFGYVNISVN